MSLICLHALACLANSHELSARSLWRKKKTKDFYIFKYLIVALNLTP